MPQRERNDDGNQVVNMGGPPQPSLAERAQPACVCRAPALHT